MERLSKQLLAVGYGLPTEGVHVFDLRLDEERDWLKEERRSVWAQRAVQRLVEQFDSGPLSLLRLCRIAVRRAVGGVHFARRVRTLPSDRIPPNLLKYVADADECLY